MSIFSRRSSKVSKRIGKIEDELSTVNARLRNLTKEVEKQGDAVVERAGERIRMSAAPSTVSRSTTGVSRPAAPAPSGEPTRVGQSADTRTGVRRDDTRSRSEPAGNAPRHVVGEDEQFANYFMSGGLKKEVVEPLRRERHVQRRKGLFLLLCFVALLFALLFFKLWR